MPRARHPAPKSKEYARVKESARSGGASEMMQQKRASRNAARHVVAVTGKGRQGHGIGSGAMEAMRWNRRWMR